MKIAVLTDPGIGGTFLSWSLYYLSGADNHWYYRNNSWMSLPEDPLGDTNSHKFSVNQLNSPEDYSMFAAVWPTVQETVSVAYMHPWGPSWSEDDCNTAAEFLVSRSNHVITVSTPPDHHFYHCRLQGRVLCSKLTDPTAVSTSWHEQYQDFVSYFFADAQIKWQQLGLTETWDQREFLALNLRPRQDRVSVAHWYPHVGSRYEIDSRDLWFMFDSAVLDLLAHLGITVDRTRLDRWMLVYHKWRKYHYNRVRFFWYFDRIVAAVLTGEHMDLERFDLDLMQEAVIQHELIYRYGLNFKTHQLTKFISTQQLHQLLEPNIHPVENIYNCATKNIDTAAVLK